MSTSHFLNKTKKLELIKFQQPTNREQLNKTHLPFSGSLRQHPYDMEKIILLAEPYGNHTIYYEFKNDDIGFAEKLPNIVNTEGEDITMVIIWIKKGSIGIRSAPFFVEDLTF